jgi:hypothetical protein
MGRRRCVFLFRRRGSRDELRGIVNCCGEVLFRNLKKSVRKKIGWAAGVVVVLTAAGIAISAGEPFAERFEGKTVRQWVRYYAEQPRARVEWYRIRMMRGTNGLVEARVIDGFGTNALKGLIAECEPTFSFPLPDRIYPMLWRVEAWRKMSDRSERIDAIAMSWAAEWADNNEEELARLLRTHKEDEFLLSVFGVSADPLTGANYLDGFTKHPDKAVRERAMKLLTQ